MANNESQPADTPGGSRSSLPPFHEVSHPAFPASTESSKQSSTSTSENDSTSEDSNSSTTTKTIESAIETTSSKDTDSSTQPQTKLLDSSSEQQNSNSTNIEHSNSTTVEHSNSTNSNSNDNNDNHKNQTNEKDQKSSSSSSSSSSDEETNGKTPPTDQEEPKETAKPVIVTSPAAAANRAEAFRASMGFGVGGGALTGGFPIPPRGGSGFASLGGGALTGGFPIPHRGGGIPIPNRGGVSGLSTSVNTPSSTTTTSNTDTATTTPATRGGPPSASGNARAAAAAARFAAAGGLRTGWGGPPRPQSSMANLSLSQGSSLSGSKSAPGGQQTADFRSLALQNHEKYAQMFGGGKKHFARIDPEALLANHAAKLQQSPRGSPRKESPLRTNDAKAITFLFDDSQPIALDEAFSEFRRALKRDPSQSEASEIYSKIQELFRSASELVRFYKTDTEASSVLDSPDASSDDEEDASDATKTKPVNDENNEEPSENSDAKTKKKSPYNEENIREMPFDLRLLRSYIRKSIIKKNYGFQGQSSTGGGVQWFGHEGETFKIASSFESLKGPRTYQEDEILSMSQLNNALGLQQEQDEKKMPKQSLFAIFDGHRGGMASRQARIHLHRIFVNHPSAFEASPIQALHDAFIETDKLINAHAEKCGEESGTTAIVALIRNNRLWIANVGDSQGVLSRGGTAFEVSNIHNPSRVDEKVRIAAARGAVVWYGTWRVNGVMAVSRSLGDNPMKSLVISTPEISEFTLHPADEFLLLATDGLWDVMSAQEAVDYVHNTIAQSDPATIDTVRQDIPRQLCQLALDKQSKDNVSILIIWFSFSSSFPTYTSGTLTALSFPDPNPPEMTSLQLLASFQESDSHQTTASSNNNDHLTTTNNNNNDRTNNNNNDNNDPPTNNNSNRVESPPSNLNVESPSSKTNVEKQILTNVETPSTVETSLLVPPATSDHHGSTSSSRSRSSSDFPSTDSSSSSSSSSKKSKAASSSTSTSTSSSTSEIPTIPAIQTELNSLSQIDALTSPSDEPTKEGPSSINEALTPHHPLSSTPDHDQSDPSSAFNKVIHDSLPSSTELLPPSQSNSVGILLSPPTSTPPIPTSKSVDSMARPVTDASASHSSSPPPSSSKKGKKRVHSPHKTHHSLRHTPKKSAEPERKGSVSHYEPLSVTSSPSTPPSSPSKHRKHSRKSPSLIHKKKVRSKSSQILQEILDPASDTN